MAAYSQESGDSTSALSAPGSAAPGRSRSTLTASPSSPSISPEQPATTTSDPSEQGTSNPSTSSPAASLASHSVLPGSELARRMTATSGRKCSALLRKSSPLGSLLKTCLASSTWASTKCYLTWRPAGTKQGRLLFQLAVSMPRTGETDCGLWPTPHGFSKDGRSNGPSGNELGNAVNREMFRTPLQSDASKQGRGNLSSQVKLWPTPRSSPNENRQTKPT